MISSERFQTSFDSEASEIKRAAQHPRETLRLRTEERHPSTGSRTPTAKPRERRPLTADPRPGRRRGGGPRINGALRYIGPGDAVSDLAKISDIR